MAAKATSKEARVIDEALSILGLSPVKQLGEGAFGKVFHCVGQSGEDFAVKVCVDADCRASAQSEAAAMGLLPPHPNVLTMSFFHPLHDCTVMGMPLATGGDTLKFMQERGCVPLAEADIRHLFHQLVASVEHLHANGMVHRDIKCENLLLTGPNRRTVLLADFGFCTRYVKGKKSLEEAWGSIHYSSPEICKEVPYEGPEIDIWSMGVVLYAWSSGRLPFGGATSEEIAARICTANFTLPRHASPPLADLISRMLEVDPEKRATLASIKSSLWYNPQPTVAAPTAKPPVPLSVSVVHLPTMADPERRRNSEYDVKKPSLLKRAVRAVFGKGEGKEEKDQIT